MSEQVMNPKPIALGIASIGSDLPTGSFDHAKETEDAAWREEVVTEAQYRAAAKASSDPEAGGVTLMWKKIFTEGHVIQKQLSGTSWIGAIALSVTIVSLLWFGYQSTIGVQSAIAKAQSTQAVTSFERWRASPFKSTWRIVSGWFEKDLGPAPVLNPSELSKIDWSLPPEVKPSNISKLEEMPEFIAIELKALAATDKLSTEFDYAELKSIKDRWVAFTSEPLKTASSANPAGQDSTIEALTPPASAGVKIQVVPRIKQVGSSIWIASVVVDKSQMLPWIGVFHKADSKLPVWTYTNVRIDGINSADTAGFDSLNVKSKPFAFAAAFPEITMLPAPDGSQSQNGGLK